MAKVAFDVTVAEKKIEEVFWEVLSIETPVVVIGRGERVFATRDELKDVLRGVLESKVCAVDVVDMWLRRVYCGRDFLGKGVVPEDAVIESYMDRIERKYMAWVSLAYLNKSAVPDTEEYITFGRDEESENVKVEAKRMFKEHVRTMRSEAEEILDRLDDNVQ